MKESFERSFSNMRVLVIGANGGVSRHFADFVKDSETVEEVAAIRNLDQAPFFEERGIESVYLEDRKSTRLNSSHVSISYAVFCLKKKKKRFSYLIFIDNYFRYI